MPGYVIKHARTRSYLERRPYDGAWTWLAASVRYATVLSKEAAEAMAQQLRAEGVPCVVDKDYLRREPEVLHAADKIRPGGEIRGGAEINHGPDAAGPDGL